jgi:hypothetical protein
MSGKPFAVLPKPFDIHTLVEQVRACVAQNGTMKDEG